MKWITNDDAPPGAEKPMPTKLSYLVQLCGVGLFLAGVVGTFKHPWITTFLLAGALIFYVGKRMRGMTT